MRSDVVTFGEVSTLDHKVLYNPVKSGAFVAQLFPGDFAGSLFTCNDTRVKTDLRLYESKPEALR